MNIKFVIILFFSSTACSPIDHVGTSVIDTSCNLTIVAGEINGKKTYFLIDTGAGVTTLDINQCKHFDFTYVDDDLEIVGFNNDIGPIKQAIGIRSIKINNVDVSGDITYTNNLTNLVRYIQQCSSKTISGIIGVPIIKKYGLVIDLPNNKLYRNQN